MKVSGLFLVCLVLCVMRRQHIRHGWRDYRDLQLMNDCTSVYFVMYIIFLMVTVPPFGADKQHCLVGISLPQDALGSDHVSERRHLIYTLELGCVQTPMNWSKLSSVMVLVESFCGFENF